MWGIARPYVFNWPVFVFPTVLYYLEDYSFAIYFKSAKVMSVAFFLLNLLNLFRAFSYIPIKTFSISVNHDIGIWLGNYKDPLLVFGGLLVFLPADEYRIYFYLFFFCNCFHCCKIQCKIFHFFG